MKCCVYCLLAVVAATSLGCGKKADSRNLQAVSGRITFGGRPLENGTIEFQPQSGSTMGGASITGGEYSIPVAQGLAPGKYTVRISSVKEAEVKETMPGDSFAVQNQQLIPKEYNTASKLDAQVEAGGKNYFQFDIPDPTSK